MSTEYEYVVRDDPAVEQSQHRKATFMRTAVTAAVSYLAHWAVKLFGPKRHNMLLTIF